MDTAGRSGSVALALSGRIEALVRMDPVRTYAERLVLDIHGLLTSRGLESRDLGGIAVSAGPGSFTGLRIAIGTALGMICALGIPLVGVETLRAWSEAYGPCRDILCPTLDAGKGLLFAAPFRWEGERLVRLGSDRVVAPDKLSAEIDGPAILWGDGAERFRGVIQEKGKGRLRILPRESWPPAAGAVALEGEARIRRGRTDPPAGFRARYVREPEAAVQWRERYGGFSATSQEL